VWEWALSASHRRSVHSLYRPERHPPFAVAIDRAVDLVDDTDERSDTE
jgi:hypothetical protein